MRKAVRAHSRVTAARAGFLRRVRGAGPGAGDGNHFRGSGDANRFRDMNGMRGFPGGGDANLVRGLPPGIAAELGLPADATQGQIRAALGLPADATMQQAWQALREKGLMPAAPPAQENGGA